MDRSEMNGWSSCRKMMQLYLDSGFVCDELLAIGAPPPKDRETTISPACLLSYAFSLVVV